MSKTKPTCNCNLVTRLVGDGCSVCNPELAAEMRHDANRELGYDANVFAIYVRHIRAIAEEMLIAYYGERCAEFDSDCVCCAKWRALDQLTENVFDESDGP